MRAAIRLAVALGAVACGGATKDDPADTGGLYGDDGAADGADGADDSGGLDGADGADGADGGDGADGADGSDGGDGGSGGEGHFSACTADGGAYTDIGSIAVEGDVLLIEAGYGGGCEEHIFTVCWPEGSFADDPPTARLELRHDGVPDPCEAYIMETLRVDLAPLRSAWAAGGGAAGATVTLELGGHTAMAAM